MKILVCGSRYATSEKVRKIILDKLTSIPGAPHTIIAGAAMGVDTLAVEAARELGFSYTEYPADWATYGKAAGPLRNKKMLEEGKPDLVLAFHIAKNLGKGTKDMVRLATMEGVKVEVVLLPKNP